MIAWKTLLVCFGLLLSSANARLRCGPDITTTTIEPTTYCPPQTCYNLYEWDHDVCGCVCPLPPDQLCTGECLYIGDCNCGCITTPTTTEPPMVSCIEITCPNGGTRNWETCECEGGATETEFTTEVEFTTYCPPQPCYGLHEWDHDVCACVCPLPFGQICGTTPTPPTTEPPMISCIEITCPNGGTRDMETCECVGGTDTTPGPTETEFTAAEEETA